MEWILKKQLLEDIWKFQLKQKFVGMDQCYLIKATENAGLGGQGLPETCVKVKLEQRSTVTGLERRLLLCV